MTKLVLQVLSKYQYILLKYIENIQEGKVSQIKQNLGEFSLNCWPGKVNVFDGMKEKMSQNLFYKSQINQRET